MPTLSMHLLGAFHVERDGQPVSGFATDKARALLAYLAIESSRPQRRETLAALFWPDQNDEHARQSLRQALSNLKQALGGDEFILASPQDIQVHPQASVVTDVGELERLIKACEDHNRQHRDIEHCLPCIQRQEAIATTYAGEFLEGFPSQNSEIFEEWLILTRERLHQAALQAHHMLSIVAERRGDLPEALKHARAQIALEPWREEAHRQAMRLFAGLGERSKALAQYQFCVRVLADELAATPTPETTALRESIMQDKPVALHTAPFPPAPDISFIGRAREQSEIAERLASPTCRMVTLLGMGGIGKSRLAMQVARAHAGLYRDGIYFIPLVHTNDPMSAIAFALGHASPDSAARLPNILRNKEMLLVLDNFEHLVDSGESLGTLLEAAPGLKMLVTSRERLRLREEWVFPLEGLSYPAEDGETASRSWDALDLFEIRANQADSSFKLTPACITDISAVCRLVEGHPLSIELAASAVADRPCAELAQVLRQTFDVLEASLRNFPARHRSLRAVFEHSWNLLSPQERSSLAGLSVFAGGFSAEAADSVTGISTAQLADLAAKSLVRRDVNGRYSLHESIRQFAAEKLDASRAEAVKQCHGQFFATLCANFDGTVNARVLDMLQKERANLRAAWEWSAGENADVTMSLLKGLAILYSLRGPLSEGESLFGGTLQSLDGDIHKQELKAHIALELARIYNAQTRHDDAIALVRSLDGAGHSLSVQARAMLAEGQALSAQGECDQARLVLEKSLAMAQEIGNRNIEADSLRELGNVANRLVEYELAAPLYQKSLALARELGDKRGESATLNNWATLEWELGELESAHTHFQQALALYRELGNRLGEAKSLNNLSNVAADQGNLAESLAYCEQALRIHIEMGNPRGQSSALNNLGATYFSLGQYDEARANYLQALALFRASGNHQAEGETLANLSLLDCVQGRLDSGRENARMAIALSEQAGDKVNLANANYYLGRVELADGNVDLAESALQHALEARIEVPHPGRLAEIRAELALAALRRGDGALARERIAPVCDALDALEGTDQPERVRGIVNEVLG